MCANQNAKREKTRNYRFSESYQNLNMVKTKTT